MNGVDVAGVGFGWRAEELVEFTGMSYRQLDYWCRRGFLYYKAGHGSGSPRLFPPEEVEIAEKMTNLVQFGLTPVVAARLARRGVSLGWSLGRVLTEGRAVV